MARKERVSAPSWLTGKADAASLAAIAEALGTQVDPATVDQLWLFPTRRAAGVESTVFVLSIHEHEDRRRVVTAHIRAIRNKRGEPAIETRLVEHATAPSARVPLVIEGVLHRLGDDYASTPPSTARIDCSMERWRTLVEVLMSAKPNEQLPERLLGESESETESADAGDANTEERNDLDD